MRFIVLGSKGFIGDNLLSFLVKKKVTIFKVPYLKPNLNRIIKSNDVIVNCLGKDKSINLTEEIKKLIKNLIKEKKFCLWVQLSTPLIYDQKTKKKLISENSKEKPFNKYALGKQNLDKFIINNKKKYFNYLILRVSTVYGKKMKSKIFVKLKALSNSMVFQYLKFNKIIFNYISVDVLSRYIYLLAKNKLSWNKLFVISQNIELNKVLLSFDQSKKLKKFSCLYLASWLLNILKILFKEQVLFLTNKKKIKSSKLNKYLSIKKNNNSNVELIKFINK